MTSKKISILFFVFIAIFQCILINGEYETNISIAFASYYEPSKYANELIIKTIFSYLSIPFMMFLVYDYIQEMTEGHYKLLIIRNYSKSILFTKKILKMIGVVFLMVLSMVIISIVYNHGKETLKINQIIESFIIYWLVIVNLVLISYGIELFFAHRQQINIGINAYFVLSLLLPITKKDSIINYIFFPRLAFANVNGIIDGSSISFMNLLLLLCSSIVIVFVICITKFKKIDIF